MNPQKFYVPRAGQLVVGVVVKRLAEFYRVDVGAARDGHLPVTAFNGATKQNAPSLDVGSLIIAGVANADPDHELMLSCVAADEVKSWSSGECYLGSLTGGMLFKVPIHFSALLLEPDNSLLHLLGEKIPYEIAVGHNGYCWLRSRSPRDTVIARQILEKCLDTEFSTFDELEEFFESSSLVASLGVSSNN